MAITCTQIVGLAINIVFGLAVLAVTILFQVKSFPALHRGFFCDDVSIRYPHNKNTLSTSFVILTCLLPVLALVIAIEVIFGVYTSRQAKKGVNKSDSGSRDAGGRDYGGMKMALGGTALLVVCILYGNGICFVLNEIIKLCFGHLRPNFLSVCRPSPDITSFDNCTGLYVPYVTCLNTDQGKLMDIRKSFVSGVASFSMFNMLFISLYLQFRLPKGSPRLIVPLLQGVAMGYTLYICGTRYIDNSHHPWDLVGGMLLGAVCALVTFYKMCPDIARRPLRLENDEHPVMQGTALVQTTFDVKM